MQRANTIARLLASRCTRRAAISGGVGLATTALIARGSPIDAQDCAPEVVVFNLTLPGEDGAMQVEHSETFFFDSVPHTLTVHYTANLDGAASVPGFAGVVIRLLATIGDQTGELFQRQFNGNADQTVVIDLGPLDGATSLPINAIFGFVDQDAEYSGGPITLAFKATLSCDPVAEPPQPASKDDCRDGGWRDYGFRNQGQCIKAVNHAGS